jgi:hypothetical protein
MKYVLRHGRKKKKLVATTVDKVVASAPQLRNPRALNKGINKLD